MRPTASLQTIVLGCWAIALFIPSLEGFQHSSLYSRTSSSRLFVEPYVPNRRLRQSKTYPATTLTWEQRYEQLQHFYRIHGHSDIPKDEPPEWTGLGQFVQRQRKQYSKWKKGDDVFLTSDKIDLLNRLDIVWDKTEVQWRERLEELETFRQEFGHTNVPMSFGTLGQWCTKQRREFNSGSMSQSRIDGLNNIGFIWDLTEHLFRHGLRQLQEFKAENRGQWPKITDGPLGSWFYSRRRQYLYWLRGDKSTLSESHRRALEEIGFGPKLAKRRSTSRTEYEWEERFEQLVEFKKNYDHVRVSRGFGLLGTWVNAQRCTLGPYKLGPGNKGSKIYRERIRQLDEIGFVWNSHTWLWDTRIEALTRYHLENGHTNVPKSMGVLGQWCELQRVEYSKYQRDLESNLSAQRVSRLNALGFDWERGDTVQLEWDLQWFRKLNLIRAYYALHGNFDVPRSDRTLGSWTGKQKTYFKGMLRGERNSLSEQRRAELDAIGFFDEMNEL